MKLGFQHTSIGKIGIAEQNSCITNLYFEQDAIPGNAEISETGLISEAFRQLEEYLAGTRQEFALPLAMYGTEFMRKVWAALCDIPYGSTATYRDIAAKIENPKATRAVGAVNNRNPIPIIIPCHRVIGTNGKLIGYRGGLELKKILLGIEKTSVSDL